MFNVVYSPNLTQPCTQPCECIYILTKVKPLMVVSEQRKALEKLSQWRGPQNIFGVINLNSIILQTMSISKEIQKISDHLFDVPKQSQIFDKTVS